MRFHGLWADTGRRTISGKSPEKQRLIGWLIAVALLPDILPTVPLSLCAPLDIGSPWDAVIAYASATPEAGPVRLA